MSVCNSKKLLAILSTLLILVVMLSCMAVPVLAEDSASESATAEAETTGESDTSDGTGTTAESDTSDGTGTTAESDAAESAAAESAADTSADTSASTEAETTATAAVNHTKGIINLIVGGVLLVAIVALAIAFRHKIPGWYKDVKSECKKIVWCPKDKLKKNSLVVIIIILAVAVVIGLLDFAFSDGIILLGKLFG